MIRHDYQCPSCGYFEATVAAHDVTIACVSCNEPSARVYLPRSRRVPPSMVVFIAKDGTVSYPGRSDDATPKNCERRELQGAHEIRRFLKEQGRISQATKQFAADCEYEAFSAQQSENHRKLRHILSEMSPQFQDIAKTAMSEAERGGSRRIHNELYHALFE